MIKRRFLQPKDMWARVEQGNLLYVIEPERLKS